MSNEIGTPAERVARGVAWLDATVPEWWNKVELKRFDIASHCRCVLGMVFDPGDSDPRSGFTIALATHRIGSVRGMGMDDPSEASRMGFDFTSGGGYNEQVALQGLWVTAIAERQAGGP